MNRTTKLAHRDESTFGLALRLLPRAVRGDVHSLYNVFHTLDDLVDEHRPEASARVAAVEAWCGEGVVKSPETHTLETLAQRQKILREPLIDFCLAMRHDMTGKPIETEDELDLYCYRAGGTVGVVIAALLGTRSAKAEAKIAKLGMAAQRTNIIRDIDEDFSNGHVYIAREAVERYGSFARGQREDLLRDQIARADALYDDGISGIPMLLQGRRAISAAAALYREILRQIEREGYGCKAGRVVVPRWRRRFIVVRHGAIPY